MSTVFDGDVTISGNLQVAGFTPPASSVGNTEMDSTDPISHNKYKPRVSIDYYQKTGTVVVTETCPLHLARANGTLNSIFKAKLMVACTGGSTVGVSINKNGVSITSGAISFTSATAAYVNINGTLSGTSVTAGDVIEIVVTTTNPSGAIGQGLVVNLDFQPDYFSV